MPEISNTYRHMTTKRLQELRSIKGNRIHRLEAEVLTYFSQQELRQLRGQVKRIDIELNCRFLQNELPLE